MNANMSTSQAQNIVQLSFKSDPGSVRGAQACIVETLKQRDLSPDDFARAEIVVAEVINNIVEHAYDHTGGQPIGISIKTSTQGVAFQFTDRGRGLPDNIIPHGKMPDVDCAVADLPEGGFGWLLIRQLSSGLEYTRINGENNFKLFLSVGDSA